MSIIRHTHHLQVGDYGKNMTLSLFICRYHHTGMISSVYAMREALALIAEEGLENCWARHKACSELLRKGVTDMGLKIYTNKPVYGSQFVINVL